MIEYCLMILRMKDVVVFIAESVFFRFSFLCFILSRPLRKSMCPEKNSYDIIIMYGLQHIQIKTSSSEKQFAYQLDRQK